MARPIDPALRAARRTQIIDAGLTAFAQYGPTATTAQICATAGIASGTFFHHFPTKDALIVAIIEYGETETREYFDADSKDASPLHMISEYIDHSIAEASDPRAAGFIRAVAALSHREAIAKALHAQEQAVHDAVASIVRIAQQADMVRADIAAERLAAWILLIIDGFTGAVANNRIEADNEAAVLHEQIEALLAQPN